MHFSIFPSLIQAEIRTLETQLNEALRSSESRSKFVLEKSSETLSDSRPTGDGMETSAVTKKLEEELKKRDALIEVCYSWQLCMIVVV